MARDNQDGALRVTHHVFGNAPDERVLETCAAVSGNDDEINVRGGGCGADFVHRVAGEKFGFNRQTAQEIHLL